MTVEEVHEYNKTHAVSNISFQGVVCVDAVCEMRAWLEKWLDVAYEAGYKAAKEGEL